MKPCSGLVTSRPITLGSPWVTIYPMLFYHLSHPSHVLSHRLQVVHGTHIYIYICINTWITFYACYFSSTKASSSVINKVATEALAESVLHGWRVLFSRQKRFPCRSSRAMLMGYNSSKYKLPPPVESLICMYGVAFLHYVVESLHKLQFWFSCDIPVGSDDNDGWHWCETLKKLRRLQEMNDQPTRVWEKCFRNVIEKTRLSDRHHFKDLRSSYSSEPNTLLNGSRRVRQKIEGTVKT